MLSVLTLHGISGKLFKVFYILKNEVMQIKLFVLLGVCLIIVSCKTRTVYIPVHSEKTEREYVDRWHRDSIYVKDSVLVNRAGDTVYIEKYKYIYKDRVVKDSVFITDSVRIEIPYPVEVEKEINRLSSFQFFQVWCGRILLLLILGFFGYKFIRKRFLF